MRKWTLSYFDGYITRTRELTEPNYDSASLHASGFPPAYIWSVEEKLD